MVTALPDLHTATLGSGATGLYEPHLSISTSAWIGCHTPGKRTSILKQIATVPAALPGMYVLANNHETAGVCVEWARNVFVEAGDGLTAPLATSLSELDAVAATAASGSGGVLFAPWLNGERSPVADTKSVLKHPLEGIRAIGGGAESDLWCQIHADVIGRPMHRVAQPLLTNVRGAAFFAGVVLGLLDVGDIAARVDVDRVFQPDPAARRTHDLLHAEFTRLHKMEQGMYARLNRPGGLE